MKHILLLILCTFTLIACDEKTTVETSKMIDETETKTKASNVIEYTSFIKGIPVYTNDNKDIQVLLTDKAYIQKVYGEVFNIQSIDELKPLLIKQFNHFDKRIVVKIDKLEAPIEQIDTLLYELIHEHSMIAGTLLQTNFAYEIIEGVTYLSFDNLFTTSKIEMASIKPKIQEILSSLTLDGASDLEELYSIHQYILNHKMSWRCSFEKMVTCFMYRCPWGLRDR